MKMYREGLRKLTLESSVLRQYVLAGGKHMDSLLTPQTPAITLCTDRFNIHSTFCPQSALCALYRS
jgi:hypothetical protein